MKNRNIAMRAIHLACACTVYALVLQNVGGAVFESGFEPKLDTFVETTMGCRHVPGLTLAVVKDNEPWAKGYGYADLPSQKAVTKDTLFNIGSVTKSFTMVLLGILLTERNMTWSTKVHDILGPEYEFVDEYRTKETTLKDLLSHRTGLARLDVSIFAGIPAEVTRESLSKQMKFLPELKPFRDSFNYNNYMYMYLGHICEILGGASWETLLRTRLLTPLGMTSSRILRTPDDVLKDDMAKPYIYDDERYQNGTEFIYTLHPLEPAGAILSSGEEMIKWMKFLLNKGRLDDGTQLVHEDLMEEAFEAIVSIAYSDTSDAFMTSPKWPIEMTPRGYGYAIFTSTYRAVKLCEETGDIEYCKVNFYEYLSSWETRPALSPLALMISRIFTTRSQQGYKRLWHSGGLFSYITQMFLYPDINTGVFVSTNGPAVMRLASWTTKTVEYFTSDGALGLEPWLNVSTSCTFPEPWSPASENQTSSNDTHRPITDPSEYTGLYSHVLFPNFNVSVNDLDTTTLRFQINKISGVLHSTAEGDSFQMELTSPFEYLEFNPDNTTKTTKVVFGRNGGLVIDMTIAYEVDVTFTKVGASNTSSSIISEASLLVLCAALLTFYLG